MRWAGYKDVPRSTSQLVCTTKIRYDANVCLPAAQFTLLIQIHSLLGGVLTSALDAVLYTGWHVTGAERGLRGERSRALSLLRRVHRECASAKQCRPLRPAPTLNPKPKLETLKI